MQHTPATNAADAETPGSTTNEIDRTLDLADPSASSEEAFDAPDLVDIDSASRPSASGIKPTRSRGIAPDPVQSRLPVGPGRVLRDRYVLTQIIGIGGMCTVFRARDLHADEGRRFIAIKTPRPDYAHRSIAIDRLRREYESTKTLRHAGIVEVFDLDCDGDIWFMTMELLDGRPLAAYLREAGDGLAPHLVRRVLRGIGDALGFAHAAGISHGDLNPANVFVSRGDRVKLIDFGSATRNGEPSAAAATFAYASPQVLEGAPPEIRDDVFSFGCIAYEALTGVHPFERRPSLEARTAGARPQAPESMTSMQALALMSALAFEREPRPANIQLLARTLAPDPQRQRTYPIALEIEPPPAQDDRRWWFVAGVCFVAMIVAVAITRLS
jgi:serine/threonine protein kinase